MTDICDQLFAAFTDNTAVGPQLLADAHAEIIRLRREALHAAAGYERQLGRWGVLAFDSTRLIRRAVDNATTMLAIQHGTELARARTSIARAYARADKAERYRDLVARIPDRIRLGRNRAGGPNGDTELLLAVLKTIESANNGHLARRPRPSQRKPEGISA